MEPCLQAASGVVEGSPKRDPGHRLMGPGLYHIVLTTPFNEQDDQTTDTARGYRHGRDNKLIVWRLGPKDEGDLEKTLPIDANALASSKQPWILHILTVNALNFCSFAMCNDGMPQVNSNGLTLLDKGARKPILIAVPNTIDSGGV